MGFWKFANEEEKERFYTEDGEDWVELKKELSKRSMNELLEFAPRSRNDEDQPSNADQLIFIQKYGELVTLGWSAVDTNGNPLGFSIDEYLSLDSQAAAWLDKTWSTHLAKQMGAEVEELEKKQETSDSITPEEPKSKKG